MFRGEYKFCRQYGMSSHLFLISIVVAYSSTRKRIRNNNNNNIAMHYNDNSSCWIFHGNIISNHKNIHRLFGNEFEICIENIKLIFRWFLWKHFIIDWMKCKRMDFGSKSNFINYLFIYSTCNGHLIAKIKFVKTNLIRICIWLEKNGQKKKRSQSQK